MNLHGCLPLGVSFVGVVKASLLHQDDVKWRRATRNLDVEIKTWRSARDTAYDAPLCGGASRYLVAAAIRRCSSRLLTGNHILSIVFANRRPILHLLRAPLKSLLASQTAPRLIAFPFQKHTTSIE